MSSANVIEVYGESGAGKTELLQEVLLRTILPPEAGGEGSGAIIFDNESSFRPRKLALRITWALEAAAQQARDAVDAAAETASAAAAAAAAAAASSLLLAGGIEKAREECLRRVHVYRCQSSFQCLLTLHAARELMEQEQRAAAGEAAPGRRRELERGHASVARVLGARGVM